jgi:carbonic anhydrase
MSNLFEGVVQFRQEDFEKHKDLFSDLGRGQSPHTLFIGCSDSRVVPTMITKSMPGELFEVRNVANIVPRYRQTSEYVATTSAIEFACLQLNIQNIVICGHSNCGGCAALYKSDEELEHLPHTKKWLEQASAARDQVKSQVDPEDHALREWMTEQANVVEQMKHLLTYPFILDRYVAGKLNIYGWHYIIETGEIFAYNRDKGYFELIN